MHVHHIIFYIDMMKHLSSLPIKYNPPEWVSTHGHPGGKWCLAASLRCHSWLCTDEKHKIMGNDGHWGFCVAKHIACVKKKKEKKKKNVLHFHPAVLRWFSSAQTQRRLGLWCRRSQCRSQLYSPLHKTSSLFPQKLWKSERRGGKWDTFLNGCTHTRTHVLKYETNILPFHGNLPFPHLSGVHVVEVSSVVVWVCTT